MNEPRLPITTVDAQRVVRQLADALNSLKTKPGPLAAPAPLQAQQQTRLRDDRVKTVRQVSRPVPNLPTGPRRMPARAASHVVNTALPPMPVFKRAPRPETRNDQAGSHQKIIEDFSGDRELIERLGVTPEEIRMLSSVSMLGNLTCKQDVLFILRQLRETKGPGKALAPVSPETLLAPYQKIEPAIPNIGEMVEWIRSEALANLSARESMRNARSRRPLGQFDFLSSIKTMFSRRRQQSAA
jgi:hypothetical protein